MHAARQVATATVERAMSALGELNQVSLVDEKSPNNYSSTADIRLEQLIVESLSRVLPLPVQSEESTPEEYSPTRWVVDPLDGTFNFLRGAGPYAISIALLVDNEPVVSACALSSGEIVSCEPGQLFVAGVPTVTQMGFVLEELPVMLADFSSNPHRSIPNAERLRVIERLAIASGRVRLSGSSVTDLALVAMGRASAGITYHNALWDVSGGIALIRAAGGAVTDFRGADWTVDSDSVLVATSKMELSRILGLIANPLMLET